MHIATRLALPEHNGDCRADKPAFVVEACRVCRDASSLAGTAIEYRDHSNTKQVIASLAKFIDWSALQMAYAVVALRHAPKSKWKLEEALEFLNGPDFIPAASDPAQIEFDGPRHFKFPTPRPGKVEENNIVYGRLYRCAERWQERPVIILLDGNPAVGYHTAFPLLARRFNRAGFNVATLVAPYDLQRRPRRPIE